MDSGKKKPLAGFTSIENKSQAPTKKSVFERQKAEAEAKRLREEAETAAVYNDFVKAFDNDGDDSPRLQRPFGGGIGGTPGSKRHFGSRGGGSFPTSGPGSLGPSPSSFSRKRAFDAPRRDNERERENKSTSRLDAFESSSSVPSKLFTTSDDEDDQATTGRAAEPAVPKPTLQLSSLPPGTSPATIKAIIPGNITVEAVRIIQTPTTNQSDRKSTSAIVTLAQETPGNEIDTAINSLQNRYMGYGYYLSLHRGLSSAAISGSLAVSGLASTNTMPFGAKQITLPAAGQVVHTAGRGFAPPTSYAPNAPQIGRNGPLYYVPVQPPRDLKELKLIHKTIENLLVHGPEFEALLMSRPEVQKEERWAWLWNARSIGGIWYRWRLWEVLTSSSQGQSKGKYVPLFEDNYAWKAPEKQIPFEYTTKLDEFVSDSDYNSSDDEDYEDEGKRKPDGQKPEDDMTPTYLNPLEKAKLTHLLARLPTGIARLRKGDVARVTAFAISHAERGSDEVVAAIVSNIEKPYAYTSANPDHRDRDRDGDDGNQAGADEDEKEDTSSASLIGLYLISDILSSSSTSGVRHAWRYRSMFEAALRQRQVFEKLGRMEKKMNWGKLRGEKWKRSVSNVLSLWEGWCVFSQDSQEHFTTVFNNPPLTAAEREKEEALRSTKSKGKWKAVDDAAVSTTRASGFKPVDPSASSFVSGTVGGDRDGVVMGEKLDSALYEDEDIDGEPMDEAFLAQLDALPLDDEDEDQDMAEAEDVPVIEEQSKLEQAKEGVQEEAPISVPAEPQELKSVGSIKGRRPKAEDMFADSDEE